MKQAAARRTRWHALRRGVGVLVVASFGCGSPQPPAGPAARVTPSQESVESSAWLRAPAERAREAGAGPLIVLGTGPGTPGDYVTALVNVPAGLCALLFARGSESVEDVDLFAYDDEGALHGSDEASDNHPTLLVCVEQGTRLYVAARVAVGQGLVALGAQEVAPDVAESVARAVGVRHFDGAEEEGAGTWPGLDEALAVHRRRMGGAWEDQRRVAVPVDARVPTRITASVGARGCVDLLALATDEVQQLDIEVLDESGRIFGRSQGGLPRTLLVCSDDDARFTYQLRPHRGRGLAVLALSSLRPGSAADLQPEVPRAVLIPPRAESDGDGRSQTSPPSRLPPGALRAEARAGRRESLALPWPGGCGRLRLESEGELLGIEAHLWAPNGDLLAAEEGLTEASLFVCSPRARLRLDVEATRRKGALRVLPEVDRTPPGRSFPGAPPSGSPSGSPATTGQSPPSQGTSQAATSQAPGVSSATAPVSGPSAQAVLMAHPLAASRLLARLHAVSSLDRPSAVGEVRRLELSETRLERVPLFVPVERCLDVFVAGGPETTGMELRLVDGISGREIELARGAHSVSARACAPGPLSTELVAEVRSVGRPTTALLATRLRGGQAPIGAPQLDLPSK